MPFSLSLPYFPFSALLLEVWIHLYKSDCKVPNLKGGGTDPFTDQYFASFLVQYNFQLRHSATVMLRSLLTLFAMV